jgi:hypothetical protein
MNKIKALKRRRFGIVPAIVYTIAIVSTILFRDSRNAAVKKFRDESPPPSEVAAQGAAQQNAEKSEAGTKISAEGATTDGANDR